MTFVLKERFLPGYFILVLFPRDMTSFQLIQNCLLGLSCIEDIGSLRHCHCVRDSEYSLLFGSWLTHMFSGESTEL